MKPLAGDIVININLRDKSLMDAGKYQLKPVSNDYIEFLKSKALLDMVCRAYRFVVPATSMK
jgi:hypothetical protein